jgi:hypothetical protein
MRQNICRSLLQTPEDAATESGSVRQQHCVSAARQFWMAGDDHGKLTTNTMSLRYWSLESGDPYIVALALTQIRHIAPRSSI